MSMPEHVFAVWHYDWTDSEVLSVWATEESANKERQRLADANAYEEYGVKSYVVHREEPHANV
jgi:hypothetical protein